MTIPYEEWDKILYVNLLWISGIVLFSNKQTKLNWTINHYFRRENKMWTAHLIKMGVDHKLLYDITGAENILFKTCSYLFLVRSGAELFVAFNWRGRYFVCMMCVWCVYHTINLYLLHLPCIANCQSFIYWQVYLRSQTTFCQKIGADFFLNF